MLIVTVLAGGLIRTAAAQSLAAGQTSGVTYVDFALNKVVGKGDSLVVDLDGDGRPDFTFSYSYIDFNYYGSTSLARLRPLHLDAAVAASIVQLPPPYGNPRNSVFAFTSGELIAQSLPARVDLSPYYGVPASNYWADNSYEKSSYLVYYNNYRGNGDAYGSWLDGMEHYAGIRLRTSSSSTWRYGWIQVTEAFSNGIVIKDYALTNTTLAAQPAAAAGWQLYPTPVTDWLTVVPPVATMPGRLTVRDLCGRSLLRTALTGSRQEVSLAALAAGVYVLELETAAGSVSQRLVKQ